MFSDFKRENQCFFSLHCPDFIKGSIIYHLWSDQPEIWRTGSGLIGLKSER